MLEDMIVVAVNDAVASATNASAQRMNSIMGGVKIPGLM
ncbi:DNA-binding protein YbaB [Parvibacter caecicola]|nr:YbaB/EbfC family nucleoid-associated protein [Parvibacter caecicola]MBB3172081.1 DNA-binding protein YbaB [Parvibacter caecicola]